MCGYCLESSIFAEHLAVLEPGSGYHFAPDLLPLRLQEALDWRAELKASPDGMCLPTAVVALCRWWMDRIHGLADHTGFEAGLGAGLVEGLQVGLRTLSYPVEWAWLGDWNGPLPDPLPLDAACSTLDLYIAHTLKADRIRGAQEQPPGMWVHLMCALAILGQATPDDPRLPLLALTDPAGSVGFLGIELWLQRRAMLMCVATHGAAILVEHADTLRNEIFASVVIKRVLSKAQLRSLSTALIMHEKNLMNLDTASLLDLIKNESNAIS